MQTNNLGFEKLLEINTYNETKSVKNILKKLRKMKPFQLGDDLLAHKLTSFYYTIYHCIICELLIPHNFTSIFLSFRKPDLVVPAKSFLQSFELDHMLI